MEKAENQVCHFFYNAVYTFLVAKSTVGWDTHIHTHTHTFNRHCNQTHDVVKNIANILKKLSVSIQNLVPDAGSFR